MRHNNGKSVAVALLGPLDIAQLQNSGRLGNWDLRTGNWAHGKWEL